MLVEEGMRILLDINVVWLDGGFGGEIIGCGGLRCLISGNAVPEMCGSRDPVILGEPFLVAILPFQGKHSH